VNLDDLVKSQKTVFSVIPAKPVLDSIQEPESRHLKQLKEIWTPAFAGVTTFYESINIYSSKFDIRFLPVVLLAGEIHSNPGSLESLAP